VLLPMSPTDSVFLTVESAQTPMHVGGLELFEPAADFGGVQAIFEQLVADAEVAPLFQKRASRSWKTAGQWGWEPDRQFDIRHHVRHNSLPEPGRVLDLLALCSRLHGTLLDRQRPLWELHLIEGLADGRFAMYFKIHHALLDGVSAQRLLQRVLTKDPDMRDLPPPWAKRRGLPAEPVPRESPAENAETALPEARHREAVPAGLGGPAGGAVEFFRTGRSIAGEVAGLPSALVKTIGRGLREQSAPVSFAAPRSMLNVPISGSRRFAGQSWSMEQVRRIRKGSGATVNDVALAACSGALRSYLNSFDALPDAPLIAMVPVALKVREQQRDAGNAVGAVMCNLGTQLSDPAERLATVHASMVEGKQALLGLTPLQIVAMTGVGLSPLLLQSMPGYNQLLRPPFNLIISNVPGPRSSLYLNGARLAGIYPLSIPYHGQALNITCTSYAGELAFGLTGCRRSVPHLQRLLGCLDDELKALEQAVS
jgi:diacylglycerol O-acyltransferase